MLDVASTLQAGWQPETGEDVNQTIAINIQGTINTVQPLIARMIERRKGQIVLMGFYCWL